MHLFGKKILWNQTDFKKILWGQTDLKSFGVRPI